MQQSRSCDLDLDWNFLQNCIQQEKTKRKLLKKRRAELTNLHFPFRKNKNFGECVDRVVMI